MYSEACLGNDEDKRMTECAEGYTGFMCANCMPGYKMRPLEFICEPCEGRDGNLLYTLI